MKTLIIVLALFSDTAMAVEIPISLEMYQFTSSLGKMATGLENQLAATIIEKCGTGAEAQVKNLSINFQNGPFAGGSGLPLWVIARDTNSDLKVTFPSHPQAILTASLQCL